MIENDYQLRFHEALAKAFSADSEKVRSAYFDLANFYYEKLDGSPRLYPPHEELRALAIRAR